ncbi:MAG TPA: NYN domain-containing protein, partial [Candidatus Paceibacterota bacterium]
DEPWQVDLARFRVYLERKYGVTKAYYYLGFPSAIYNDLYEEIQTAGFILRFRKHNPAMQSVKKGNVDTEIVFDCMHRLCKQDDFEDVVLVSRDGDYYRLVEFLFDEGRLEKVLFPNEYASSLYKQLTRKYFDNLSSKDIREKIGRDKKKRGP